MDMGKEISQAMEPNKVFSFDLFGFTIPVTDTVIVMWIVMAVLIILSIIFTRKMELIPTGKQKITEIVVDAINKFAEGSIEHHSRHFAPYLGTILLFLCVSNILSVFNIIPNWEQLYNLTHVEFFEKMPKFSLRPPTKDLNVTVAMALMTMVIVVGAGIRFKKLFGWLKSFIEPTPIMLPMKILEYFIRPISLSLRLFGNIIGGFIVMELLYMVMPAIIPGICSLYFDLFDGLLQAYVFVFLTSLYIGEAIE